MLITTDWLKKMPTRELGSSFDAPDGTQGIATTLLKRHKTLPHPRRPREKQVPEFRYSSAPFRPRDLVIDTKISSAPSSETSSPRTLKHASKRIGTLPPTPPAHSRQSSESRSSISPSIKNIGPSTPSTPPAQQSSPLTPDITPPRPRAIPLAFRPSASDRYPSRTDSFRTAREDPYSSDEDEVSTVRPALPSAKTSATEVQTQKRKEVGLGLGLESDNDRASTPKATKEDRSQEEFGVFDGGWGGDTSEVEREWDDNLMRNVTVRKRPRRSMAMYTDDPRNEVYEDHIITPTMATKVVRNLPLQDRIVRHRLARDITNGTPAETLGKHAWLQPAPTSTPPVDESPTQPDHKRFSSLSGPSVTSTIIEAMVLDAAPQRRKTLRHTRKQLGLRDLGSDHSVISSESLASSEPRHRLRHSSAKLPDIKQLSVFNAKVSTTVSRSSAGLTRKAVLQSGAIPVVIIPERRSSSQSRTPSLRSTSSRKSKKTTSLSSAPRSASLSAPLSQSSKYNEPGYFDNNVPRKRTMSDSAGSSRSVRTIDYPPSIPVRRSSLSAPTSRDTSRAGSLTAESLKAHNMIQLKKQEVAEPKILEPSQPSERTERTDKDASTYSHRSNVDHNGDPFFGNRLSTQVTPFSQISYETAGTMAEVSEALAVSIFPHQNKSVLVVQQRAPSDSTLMPLQTAPSMAVNGQATTGPATPPQPIHPMDEVDSPLKNPRDPPEPPAIKFIPATPSGLTPSQEEERQLGHGPERPSLGDGKRTMSLMRRLSGRESLDGPAQRPNFLARTFSLGGKRKDGSTQTSKPEANVSTLYPSVADKPPDSTKLHPFWRPAGFWDDLQDDDNGYDDYDGYPPVDDRPQRTFSQKLKRTFAILPIEDDHLYNSRPTERRTVQRTPSEKLRVVKKRSNSSLTRERASRSAYTGSHSMSGPSEGSFGYGFKEGNGGRSRIIPGLNVRVEYVGWSGMRRRFSERSREKRSEKLRQSISGPKGVQNGMDDVLQRRSRVAN